MIELLTNDRRVTVAEVPADLLTLCDRRSEELRLAQFAYSATVLAGDSADFRYMDGPHHEMKQ